jgi:hypothetical protein
MGFLPSGAGRWDAIWLQQAQQKKQGVTQVAQAQQTNQGVTQVAPAQQKNQGVTQVAQATPSQHGSLSRLVNCHLPQMTHPHCAAEPGPSKQPQSQ